MGNREGYLLNHCYCGELGVTGCCGRIWCAVHSRPHLRGKHSYDQPLDEKLRRDIDEAMARGMGEWEVPSPPAQRSLAHDDTCAIYLTGECDCPYRGY